MMRYSAGALVLCAGMAWSQAPAPDIRFAFPDALRVWPENGVIPVPVIVEGLDEARPEVSVRVELVDMEGESLGTPAVVHVREGRAEGHLRPGLPGWYELRAILVAGGEDVARATTAIAVLPRFPRDPGDAAARRSPFGVCTHFGRPAYDRPEVRTLLELSGIRWIRDNLYWGKVEKEAAGQYQLPERVAYNMRELHARGIRTLAILGYGCPWYTHHEPEAVQPFERCCEYVARVLAGTVDHFEIWNEPNAFGKLTPELYPPILKAGYRGVKRGNPEAFVVGLGGASPGGWSAHYIVGGIYKQDAVGFMDSFSIHPYCSPFSAEVGYNARGAPAPLACLAMADRLTAGLPKRIQVEKGLSEPPGMWITELGWPVTDVSPIEVDHEPEKSEVLPAGQAQFVARALLFAAAHPRLFERCFLYEFVTTPGPKMKFGLLREDLSPRPAFVAASVAANSVADRPFRQRIEHPDDRVHLYVFGPDEDPLITGWITEVGPARKIREPEAKLGKAGSAYGVTVTVDIPVQGRQARCMDWQGRIHLRDVTHGRLVLDLTTWPQYVRGVRPESCNQGD